MVEGHQIARREMERDVGVEVSNSRVSKRILSRMLGC